jgi:PAS domain S-box-containing protein
MVGEPMSSLKSNQSVAIDAFAHFEQLTHAVLITETTLSAPGPRILYVNPAFERMTGWSRGDIVGCTPRVLQGPETDRVLMRDLKAALQRGESWTGETTNYRRDGTAFIMKWSVSPVCDADGHVRRYLAIQEDVTELRARERREAQLQAMTQQLMAAASEGIVVTDAAQRITSFGAGAEQIFGWREQDILGEPLSVLVPERYRAGHVHHMQRFASDGGGVHHMAERGEVAGLHRDGREFPALVTVADIGARGGDGFIAVVRDLSIRKAQARKLAESERRYRAVFNLTYQFVGLLTADGRVLEANQTALAFFDGTLEAVHGKHFLDTPWFEDSPDAREIVRTALDTAAAGQFVRGQMTLKAPDGILRTFDYSIRPVFDAAGTLEYLIPEGRDITDLVRSTEDLKARKRQLNEAQRIARVGDWRWDIGTGRLAWSEEIFRIFGMDPGQEPTYAEFLAAVHPEDRVDVEARVRAAVAGREPYALDHRIVLPDGSERIVHEQAEVRHGADGRPIEMIGIVQDVTKRKHMEQALLDAKRDAETANEAKSRFLSTMGHELRTPLNAINGFSQLIAEETFGPVGSQQYAEYAHLIHQSGHHLLDVINTILDATRIESGRMELAADWFSAQGFLQHTLDLARAESGRPEVEIQLGKTIDAEVLADRRLLRQALLNLVGNAVKFSPPGAVVSVSATVSPAGAFEIAVSDEGPGIPAEAIERVTLPFFQADDSLSRTHEGSGLGLYLAKSFLELHGGRLEIMSPRDGGTVAALKLPPSRVRRD